MKDFVGFKDFSLFLGLDRSPWIGMENFLSLVTDPQFLRAVRNTLAISAASLLFAFPVPILLALMFNELRIDRVRRWVQTIVTLPHQT